MGGKTTKDSAQDKNYHEKLTNIAEAIQRNDVDKLKALLEDKEITSNSFEDIIYLLEHSEKPLNFNNIDIINLLLNDKRLSPSSFEKLTALIKNNCNNNADIMEIINAYKQIIDYYKLFNQQIHQYIIIEKSKEKTKKYNVETENYKFKCIYNNNQYDNDTIEPASKSFLNYIIDIPAHLFNRKKGANLFLDTQNTTPIGYNIHLPQGQPKAIIVKVYGGNKKQTKDETVNTPLSLSKFDTYLLNNGIAVVTLNLPDLLELDVYQGNMPEDLFIKIQDCINMFYQQLTNNPKELHAELSPLRGVKTYLYGASFGGLVSIRHAELFPNNFDGYISHDGAISTEMMYKADIINAPDEDKISNIKRTNNMLQKLIEALIEAKIAESLNNNQPGSDTWNNIKFWLEELIKNNTMIENLRTGMEVNRFNDYLNPANEDEMTKITKPIYVLQNQDDNTVHVKVATDFYKKMQIAGKADLIKLLMTKTSNPATPKERIYKGHYIPENENDFITYCEGILSFMLGSSELADVNKLEVYRHEKRTNKYYRKAELQQEFIAEAFDKFEKSLLPYKNFDLSKLAEMVDEYFQTHWEREYQPLYYGLHYSKMLTDGHHENELHDELDRLNRIMTDEMIINVLKYQQNLFHQYLDEFLEFKAPSTVSLSDLTISPQMIKKYREMFKNIGTDIQTVKYFLSTFYKANPDIFLRSDYIQLFSKDPNLQHDLQQAKVKMNKIIHKIRSRLVMLNFINALDQVEKSNHWNENNIKQLQTHFQKIKEQLSAQNKAELNNHIYLQLKILVKEQPINVKAIAALLSFAKDTTGFKGLFNFTLIELLKTNVTFNNLSEIDINRFINDIPNNSEAFKTDQGFWDYDGSMLANARKAYVFCDRAYTELLMDMEAWSKNYAHVLSGLSDFITSDTADFIKRQVKLREEALVQQLKDIESIKEAYRNNIVNAYKNENPNLKSESEKRITDKITSWEKELNAPQRIRNIKAHFNTILPQRASATKEYKKQMLLPSKGMTDKKAPKDPGTFSSENHRRKKIKRH